MSEKESRIGWYPMQEVVLRVAQAKLEAYVDMLKMLEKAITSQQLTVLELQDDWNKRKEAER